MKNRLIRQDDVIALVHLEKYSNWILDETHPTQGRRSSTTPGYEEWEFCVFTGTFLVGALWSIQLGIKLTHLGLQLGWSITVASFVGVIGLFTGPGYFTVGVIYGGIWPAFFREKGKSAEEAEYEEVE